MATIVLLGQFVRTSVLQRCSVSRKGSMYSSCIDQRIPVSCGSWSLKTAELVVSSIHEWNLRTPTFLIGQSLAACALWIIFPLVRMRQDRRAARYELESVDMTAGKSLGYGDQLIH